MKTCGIVAPAVLSCSGTSRRVPLDAAFKALAKNIKLNIIAGGARTVVKVMSTNNTLQEILQDGVDRHLILTITIYSRN